MAKKKVRKLTDEEYERYIRKLLGKGNGDFAGMAKSLFSLNRQ